MKAITIKNLSKTYTHGNQPVKALDDVSFSIEQGEIFGLLGPNGAGKSTLINILSGVTKKNAGEISVLGFDLDTQLTELKKSIGVVPQEIGYEGFFPIRQQLSFQFGYYGLKHDEEHLQYLLAKMRLTDKQNEKPRMLSGGMQRRLMIVRALIHKPKVLILDEPTAGVDVELRHEMYDLIRELNASGTTIVLTSHYLEEVELLCERVAIINKGKLVALDNKKNLKNRFQSTRHFSIALTDKEYKVSPKLDRFSPQITDGELVLTFQEHEYKDVLSLVAEENIPLSNFTIIEPSLEDVFLSLTDNGKTKK